MMENGLANKRLNLDALAKTAKKLKLPNLSTLIAWAEGEIGADLVRAKFAELEDPSPKL